MAFFTARIFIFAGLGFALLRLFLASAAGQSAPLPIDVFWQKVEDTRTWLNTNPPTAAWSAQAGEWAAVREVLLPDGATLPISTHEMVKLLRADPPDPERLEAYLTALLQARERWAGAGDGAGELAALQIILARPEFQAEPENLLDQLYQRILEILQKVLDFLIPDSGQLPLPIPRWLVIGTPVLVLAGILAYIFRDIWRSVLREVELSDEDSHDSEILSSGQASRRAQQLSSSGDYRQAVRYLYLSALLLLDERGLLRYNRTLTNREYLRQLSSRPDLASRLYPVIDTFDRVWYGFETIDEQSYTRYSGQVSALEETKE